MVVRLCAVRGGASERMNLDPIDADFLRRCLDDLKRGRSEGATLAGLPPGSTATVHQWLREHGATEHEIALVRVVERRRSSGRLGAVIPPKPDA
jgi:hypothetical protein